MMRKLNRKSRAVTIGFALLFILVSGSAFGAGFRLPEVSIAGLGMADALVANSEELGALAYNPAAMSFHPGISLSLGVVLLNPNITVAPTGGSGTVESDGRSIIPVPNLYAMYNINPNWAVGLGINAPFGLETKWPNKTFPGFAPPLDPFEPALTKVEMINFNPNVSYKIDAYGMSIAFGVDFYSVQEVVLDTQAISVKGDGSGIGWNAALLHVNGPLSVGLSYRSPVDVDIEGTFDATGIGSTSTSMSIDGNFPDILQVGIRYMVCEPLALEFDIEYTGWNRFEDISISHSSPPPVKSPFVETHNWSNTLAYHLGGSYQLNPKIQLRGGYVYDTSPVEEANFSARLPDNDRHALTVGIEYAMGTWAVEAGYKYILLKDRRFSSSTAFAGGDPNGTAAFNGNYETYANLFGIGLNAKF